MRRKEPIFCMPISGRHGNGKTLGELKIQEMVSFLNISNAMHSPRKQDRPHPVAVL